MTFKVEWHKKARKELRELPKNVAKQLIIKAAALADNPMHNSAPLEGSHYRRIRSGNYRAIIEVTKDKIVKVLMVGHRKNIYKKFFR